MITEYHRLDPTAAGPDAPAPRDLELVAVVPGADDPADAFDRVIHRDGENWTHDPAVVVFGDPRGRRSTHDGDVLVTPDGLAHLVLPLGFRPLPALRLPYLA